MAEKGAGEECAGGGGGLSRRAAPWILSVLAVFAAAAMLALPPDRPRLFGIPFFYVLQFAVCVVSAAVTVLPPLLRRRTSRDSGHTHFPK